MIKNLKNYFKTLKNKKMFKKVSIYLIALVFAGFYACGEEGRFQTSENDRTPTGPPTNVTTKALDGGVRFYYTIPVEENLLSIDAEFTNASGNTFRFSSSMFTDSLDVFGFSSTEPQEVRLFGVNRAGVRSVPFIATVSPLSTAVESISQTVDVKPAFGSFIIDWLNELGQMVNVYVDFKFTDETGEYRDIAAVFSSNRINERRFVRNLDRLPPLTPIDVTLRVQDFYGNTGPDIPWGNITLLEDREIDKSTLRIPFPNDSLVQIRNGEWINSGVPAMFGDNVEGRMAKLIDGVIDNDELLNFFHTGGRGRTGLTGIARQNDWNIIIDLGAYYRLSRIVTHQRHTGNIRSDPPNFRGQYYHMENCGVFKLWIFDEELWCEEFERFGRWDSVPRQRTPIPLGVSDMEMKKIGQAGDLAYFFPEEPAYTKPTRWFRYEYLYGFEDNYTSRNVNCMSELTIYGMPE